MRWLVFFFLALVLFSCAPRAICDEPYIRFERECCLDLDENAICDEHEGELRGNTDVDETEIKEEVEPELIPLPFEEPAEPEEDSLFSVEVRAVKNTIRIRDQAIFDVSVTNNGKKTETYLVSSNATEWTLMTTGLLPIVRIPAAAGRTNEVRIVVTPLKKYITEEGDFPFTFQVRAERIPETQNVDATIYVRKSLRS